MVAVFTKPCGAEEGEAEIAPFGVVPDGFVGNGWLGDLPVGDLKGAALELDFGGWGRKPLLEGFAEGSAEGGDLAVVGLIRGEGDGAIAFLGVTEEGGEGEGFFVLVVVEIGGEIGIDLADLVEEPGVEPVGVVAGESAALGWSNGELEANEVGLGGPGEDGCGFGTGHSGWKGGVSRGIVGQESLLVSVCTGFV